MSYESLGKPDEAVKTSVSWKNNTVNLKNSKELVKNIINDLASEARWLEILFKT